MSSLSVVHGNNVSVVIEGVILRHAIPRNCKLGDVQANLARMNDLARRISRKEVDVRCYPELVTTGYSLGQKWVELAETVPGPTTDKLGQVAREFGFHLIAGISERDPESGRIFNSAVLINSEGEVAGAHRKVHLWDEERRYFTPRNEFKVFKTKVGTLGIGICYDLEFSETSRILALCGAEILFFPSAEMISTAFRNKGRRHHTSSRESLPPMAGCSPRDRKPSERSTSLVALRGQLSVCPRL